MGKSGAIHLKFINVFISYADKLYMTRTEYAEAFGAKPEKKSSANYPFTTCSISLQDVVNPVCTKAGVIYELTYALSSICIAQFQPHFAISAETQEGPHHTRAPDGTPICPVSTKNLQSISSSENQPVVVLTSGYVYAESTIKEFCYKAGKGRKSWNCLVTDQGSPFSSPDLDSYKQNSRNPTLFF